VAANDRDVPVVPRVEPASALERAARAAERQPVPAPRDDQWIYTHDGNREQWKRVDGQGWATRGDDGKVHVELLRVKPRAPLDGYKQQAALPTDPAKLREWAYAQTDDIEGAGTTADAEVYAIFRGLLGAGVLPRGDAATYAYAGRRSVKVGPTGKPGDGGTLMRETAGIVDRPGEYPKTP
jgi:hypothetical protein